MSVNSTAKELLFSVVSMMLKMPIVYFFIVHPILTWVFVYINCPTRAIQLTEVRSLGKNQGCGTMCMKKWVFDPQKKQNRGSWTLALKILSYKQPMESYKVFGAF